jgi:hypothetical protein
MWKSSSSARLPSKKIPFKYGVCEMVKYVKKYVDLGKLMFLKHGYKWIEN